MNQLLLAAMMVTFLFGCAEREDHAEASKKEILQAEKDFARMAKDKGLAEAFSTFIAEDGVVESRDTLLKGKQAVRMRYENTPYKNVSLDWHAEFVDAAASGELGYTYGPYTFKAVDSSGKAIERKGYFHTVWKKQPDGKWRFVWD